MRDTDRILATALTSQQIFIPGDILVQKGTSISIALSFFLFLQVDFVVLARTLGNLPFTPSNLERIWPGSRTGDRKINIRTQVGTIQIMV